MRPDAWTTPRMSSSGCFVSRMRGGPSSVYVAIGNSATEQTRKEAWQVLNALIFCDPASPPGDCL
jgi:hypothetical protein